MKTGKKDKEDLDISQTVGGTLNLFGLNLDLGKLLSSAEDATSQLDSLRQRLKDLGGKEVLSNEDWKRGAASVSGHVRVRDLSGEREYHIGTSAGRQPRAKPEKPAEPPETVEPPLDVFDEAQGVTIVADVPGISLEDLDIKVEDYMLSISTRPTARRSYNKSIRLPEDVDMESLESNCRNGVLDIRLRKKKIHAH